MLDERLAAALAALPADGTGVVDEDATPPRAITWGELRTLVARYRAQLSAIGVRPGQLVPILARQTPESVAVICALLLEGAAFCFLSERFTPADRRWLVEQMDPIGLVVDEHGAELIAADAGAYRPIALGPDGLTAAGPPRTGSTAFVDVAHAHFSSGSTGRPKAVLGSRDGLVHFADVQISGSGITAADRQLCIVSFASNLGLVQIFSSLFSGASLHLSRARGKALGDVIRTAGITGLGGSTPMWTAMLGAGDADEPLFGETPTLRYVFTGGLHMPRARLERLFARLGAGVTVYEIYGQAEVRQMTHFPINAPEHRDRIESVGRTVEGSTLFVATDEESVAPPGTVGEIAHVGPGIMLGYLGQPELTASQLRSHAAFPDRTVVYTGDLGFQDAEGYVYLKGRASRVITLADGTTVWPAEIENALGAHPEVIDALAAGVVVDGRVQVAVAVVTDPGVAVETLQAALPVAAQVRIWPELPTTPNGKPAVARVTAMLTAELTAG